MVDMKALSDYHTSDAAKKFLRKRHASEARFKIFGLLAIAVAVAALAALVWTIGANAARALYEYDARMTIAFSEDAFDPSTAVKDYHKPLIEQGIMSEDTLVRGEFRGQITTQLNERFLGLFDAVAEDDQSDVLDLLSGGNIDKLFAQIFPDGAIQEIIQSDGEARIGAGASFDNFEAQLSDDGQLYFKGVFGTLEDQQTRGILSPVGTTGEIELLDAANDFQGALAMVKAALLERAARQRSAAARQQNAVTVTEAALADGGLTDEKKEELERALEGYVAARDRLTAEADDLENRAAQPGGEEALSPELPSVFVFINGGVAKVTTLSNERVGADVIRDLSSDAEAQPGEWRLAILENPEAGRKINDVQVVYLEELREKDLVVSKANWSFLYDGDSREAELAGVWGGLVGSFWTMVVTFSIAFPIGVMAAIYLEEFAPKNAFTDFIEVNINNLAAIPSIIFGLFGLLLLLSGFEIPIFGGVEIGGWFKEYRSAAFVGGIVLALMTLPTIIIAGRASVRAVPPSIRSAALGLGASKVQTVFHHVLPLAMPGIMTGTIIGMAQALGETAPLLMVGMVGFFADVAGGVTDPTTVMPALVYFWSDYPENLFELKTSLAIVVLLLFLIAMNALAVLLRKRFERRW